ncbi:MAG: TetR/AcrR family transcriptional regulator [Rubrivivax sp.]
MARSGTDDTRQRILDAAEALFAERGYHGASLRQIAEGAGVAVSVAQYHYDGKETLYCDVVERRIAVLNHERLGLLDKAERDSPDGGPPQLSAVLQALIEPIVRYCRSRRPGAREFAQILGQVSNDPGAHARRVANTHFDPIGRYTMKALARALPGMPADTLALGYIFVIGSIAAAVSPTGRLASLANGANGATDVETADAIVQRLLPFATAGFMALAGPAAGR